MFRMSSKDEADAIRDEWKGRVTKHPLYRTWTGMKTRCKNRRVESFRLYGGRGIRMCDRWSRDFSQFAADAGERPNGMTIDRIDTNGNYEPSNCRWATSQVQGQNKRKRIEYEGKSVATWAEELGMPTKTLRHRVRAWGWEYAICLPYWGPFTTKASNGS